MAGEEIAEVLDADVALEVRQREVADLAAHADDEPGREHAPPGKARERELPIEEREGDAERQSPERSFDRLVRREDGPAVAAEELAGEEREDVVQLRREHDVDDEAEAVLPDREVREVGEEPREVHDADDREGEALQHALGAIADDRHEREKTDGPDRRDHEEAEATEDGREVHRDDRRVHDEDEEPLAVEPGGAGELLEAV